MWTLIYILIFLQTTNIFVAGGYIGARNVIKGVTRGRKSKDSQYTGQAKKDIRTNNDLQNITL